MNTKTNPPVATGRIQVLTGIAAGSGLYEAMLDLNPEFKSTSTRGEEFAARNVAAKYFFGTSVRRDFPDDESKIKLLKIGEHLYEATYKP